MHGQANIKFSDFCCWRRDICPLVQLQIDNTHVAMSKELWANFFYTTDLTKQDEFCQTVSLKSQFKT